MSYYKTFVFIVLFAVVVASNAQHTTQPIRPIPLPMLPPLGKVNALPGQDARSGATDVDVGAHIPTSIAKPAVYRHVMKDGSVAYSDKFIAGASSRSRIATAHASEGIIYSSAGSSNKSPTVVPINDAASEVRINPELGISDQILADALKRQKEAAVVTSADRSFSSRKNKSGSNQSRLSEQYFKRQAEAAAEVAAARAAVEDTR